MTKDEFIVLLDRYLAGQATKQDQAQLDQFFNAFQGGAQNDRFRISDSERLKMEIYTSLNRRIDLDTAALRDANGGQWMRWSIRVAASILVFITTGWLGYTFFLHKPGVRYLTQTTARGQRMTIPLSDGSVIKLNAASSVTYPEKFSDDVREVSLIGEAFFSVKRDTLRPFHVRTGELQTSVLGTSFNIRAYIGAPLIEVTVKTGSVAVASLRDEGATKQGVILHPDEQAQYTLSTHELSMRTVQAEHYLAWTSDILYLDNTSIHDMAAMLEQWYDIQIILEDPALGNCRVSGKYKSDRLSNILEGLHFMQGITYRYESDRVLVLRGKPCK